MVTAVRAVRCPPLALSLHVLLLPALLLLLLAPAAAAATSFHAGSSPPPLLLAGMRESVTVTVTLLNTGDDNVTLAVNGSVGVGFTLAPLGNTTLTLTPLNAGNDTSSGAVAFMLNATGAAPANATLNLTVVAVAWEGEAPAQRWANLSLPVRYETPQPRLEMTPEAATLTLEIGPAEAPGEGRDGVALNLYDRGNTAIRGMSFAIVFDPGAPTFNTTLSGLCAGVAGALCAYQVTVVAPAGTQVGNYSATVTATGRAWEGAAAPLNVTAVTNLSLMVREATPVPPPGANDTTAPTDETEPTPAPGVAGLALVLVLVMAGRRRAR